MKILFASMPFDGHFLPMTGVAQHLCRLGHEVHFYTGPSYATRLQRLGVPHEPFRRAVEVNAQNIAERFPEIATLRGPKRLAFDVEKIFFANIEAHYRDVLDIHAEFPFDALVNDAALYAAYPITRKLGIPAYGIAPAPTPTAKSAGAPPPFFGLTPATNPLAHIRHRVIWAMVESTTRRARRIFDALLAKEGLPAHPGSIFQLPWDTDVLVFQTGTPSMDFEGIDWPANHIFVGPLLPPQPAARAELPFADRLRTAPSVVVVSQGTADNRDSGKLFVPTLTALGGTEHLVVACTGGRHTAELRRGFPHDNVLVEDWVDFHALLPHADVFITNGGYGSVMQALMNEVRIVTAGTMEAKNDVNVRLSHNGLAVDLKTETPRPEQIARSVAAVLHDPSYLTNVQRVAAQLRAAHPLETITDAVVRGSSAARRPG